MDAVTRYRDPVRDTMIGRSAGLQACRDVVHASDRGFVERPPAQGAGLGRDSPDVGQIAGDAVQHPGAARGRRAGARRLRRHRRARHRGDESRRRVGSVRRARSPRAGAHRKEPRALRPDERLCYYSRKRRAGDRGFPERAIVVRSHPAGSAVRGSGSRGGGSRGRAADAGRRPRPRACAPPAGGSHCRPALAHASGHLGRFGAVLLLMSTLAVYPGSFDPLTNGHVDIISRGARLFDRIIVSILVNAEKSPLFSMDERVEITREVFKDQPNVEVDTFDGLLVDYVERRHAQVIVRGLRAGSDFEFEFQLALMNQRLNAKIHTVFMIPAEQYTYISSRLIKEVFALGGRVHGLVPDTVETRLREKVTARDR